MRQPKLRQLRRRINLPLMMIPFHGEAKPPRKAWLAAVIMATFWCTAPDGISFAIL